MKELLASILALVPLGVFIATGAAWAEPATRDSDIAFEKRVLTVMR